MAPLPPGRPHLHQGPRRPHPRGVGRVRPVPTPTGPLSRFLQDPDGFLQRIVEQVREVVPLAALALVIVVVLLVGASIWRWSRQRRLIHRARRIRILPPPSVDAAGARMLWMGL